MALFRRFLWYTLRCIDVYRVYQARLRYTCYILRFCGCTSETLGFLWWYTRYTRYPQIGQ